MSDRFVCVSLGRRRAEEVLRFVPPTLRKPRRVRQPQLVRGRSRFPPKGGPAPQAQRRSRFLSAFIAEG